MVLRRVALIIPIFAQLCSLLTHNIYKIAAYEMENIWNDTAPFVKWFHVPKVSNPANLIARGIRSRFLESGLWMPDSSFNEFARLD